MALEENERQKKSRDKFVIKIKEIQKKAYSQILDQVESVVVALAGNPEAFKPLRAKILRASNDAIRQLEKELERSYILEYESITEDVIVFNQNK
jgi:hypothetical protein